MLRLEAIQAGARAWVSKTALELVSLTLANELKAASVAVISVGPGDMRTRMYQNAFLGEGIPDRPLPQVNLPFWAWLPGQSGVSPPMLA